MDTDPVLLVGRRPDRGWRDQIWAHCAAWWKREFRWPIHVGYHLDGPFSLAAASNAAARSASAEYDWDVAVYIGADVLPGTVGQVLEAVATTRRTGMLTFGHDHYYPLTEEGTRAVLAGDQTPHGSMAAEPAHTNTFSSVLAIPRSLWEQVGGFDERFVGWGFEDLAFFYSAWSLAGGFERVTGPIFHLWHPRDRAQREDHPLHELNRQLWERYLRARPWPHDMRALIGERTAS